MYAGIPGWRSRDRWLGAITRWLLSAEADTTCRAHKLHDRAKILAIAGALADFADHDTGRRCAPAYDTVAALADVARITVRRAEAILAAGGWLRVVWSAGYLTTAQRSAARAQTGRRQVRSGNVRALTMPAAAHVSTGHEHQPAPKAGKSSSFSSKNSSTRAKARRAAPRPTEAPTKTGPRPLDLQQLAAALVHRMPFLARTRHIGAVCDALSWAGITLQRWGTTANSAAHRLIEALTKQRRIPTADQCHSPIGWLHSALATIDPDQPTPVERERHNTTQLQAARAAAADQAAEDRAAAVPLAESSAADTIRAALAKLAASPVHRRDRDLPITRPTP